MKLIMGPRQSGKTTELIELCSKEPNGYIVCRSIREVMRIEKVARESGKKIRQPVTYDEFLRFQGFPGAEFVFFIDDVLELLRYIAARDCNRIGAVTIETEANDARNKSN